MKERITLISDFVRRHIFLVGAMKYFQGNLFHWKGAAQKVKTPNNNMAESYLCSSPVYDVSLGLRPLINYSDHN